MTQEEIFEKLKEALDYNYLLTDFGGTEVTNIEEYIKAIKFEREFDKQIENSKNERLKAYQEFIKYLADNSIGDTKYIIEEFNNCTFVSFVGYKKVTKEIIDNDRYIHFIVDEIKLKAKWQPIDNYAVWQISGYLGDDYSGYMLFPTYDDNEYFCLEYKC